MPDLAPVVGRVTLDGNPLPGVQVTVIPENGRASVGFTDKDGNYKAVYLADKMGVKIGASKVSINYFVDEDADKSELKSKPPIPVKYNAKTGLTVEIKPGKNVHNFELTSN